MFDRWNRERYRVTVFRTTGYNDLVASKGKKLHGTKGNTRFSFHFSRSSRKTIRISTMMGL